MKWGPELNVRAFKRNWIWIRDLELSHLSHCQRLTKITASSSRTTCNVLSRMVTEKYHSNGSLRERDFLVVDGRADATRPEKAVR
jgi:hypothetical protein